MIIIKTKNYKSTDDFIYDVLGEYEKCEEFDCVNIVSHYDVMVDILNQLVKTTDFELANIRIDDVEINNYADEYILTITKGKIWCQEAKYDTGYVSVDDITFVHSDCNSKFVIRNRYSEMIEFSINGDENFNGLQIGTAIDENGGMPGFTSTWSDDRGYSSYSFYSDDKDLVKEMLDNVKSFYLDR